jgi:hypothetical protein
MKFAELTVAHEAAKERLKSFEGDNNWPGLTAHDRVYALPVDYQDEGYTAIVRAHMLYAHESCPIAMTIWHWHWRDSKEVEAGKLSADQLAALAEIKRTVRRWIDGEIDELPPSTCRHLAIPKEEPR